MEFQLSYFKSPNMMLWKWCTQYPSKFWKLSSVHRTGKGQFSFQSQRKERKKKVKSLSHVQLLATPWTVAHQAPPSIGFSRQEYWSGLPFPSPGDLPNPGIETSSPTLQADTLPSEPPGKPKSIKSKVHSLLKIYCFRIQYTLIQASMNRLSRYQNNIKTYNTK